jgi:putative transposase
MRGVLYIVSDNHAGLKAAREARLSGVLWQCCQFHRQQNACHYLPRVDMRAKVASDLRAIFNSPDPAEAERHLQIAVKKYEKTEPKLAAWISQNAPEGLAIFTFPEAHRRRLRTSNMLERIKKEI